MTATSTASADDESGGQAAGWAGEIGVLAAVAWGATHLRTSQLLLAVVLGIGVFQMGLMVLAPVVGPTTAALVVVGSIPVYLFMYTITMCHAGIRLGAVDGSASLGWTATVAIPRLLGATLVVIGPPLLALYALGVGLLPPSMGLLVGIGILLWVLHTILVLPAVCTDSGVRDGTDRAMAIAGQNRHQFLGLLLAGAGLWLAATVVNVLALQNGRSSLLLAVGVVSPVPLMLYALTLVRTYVGYR